MEPVYVQISKVPYHKDLWICFLVNYRIVSHLFQENNLDFLPLNDLYLLDTYETESSSKETLAHFEGSMTNEQESLKSVLSHARHGCGA